MSAVAPWFRPPSRIAVAGGALALVTCLSSTARAALPPTEYHGIRPAQPTALILDEEFVVIACPPADDVLRCTASAHYAVSNPTTEQVETDAPVIVTGIANVRVVRDGQPSSEQPWLLHLSLAPGARTLIDVSFPLEFPSRAAESGLSMTGEMSAMEARHPVLGGNTRAAPAHPVYFRWSENWAGVRARNFDVRYPSGWKLHGSQWRAQGAVSERSVTKEISSSDAPVDIDLRRIAPIVPVANGGPVVAVGSALGDGFRMRYGYEVGVFDWMIPSLAADVDYAGLLVVTPTLDAATTAKVPVPSLAAGLGMPVRLHPDTRAGARLKLSAVMVIGLEATIDYYPSNGDWETTIAGRLSL